MNIFAAKMDISGKSEVSFIPLGVVVCLILCVNFSFFIILCRGTSVVQTRFSRTAMNMLLRAYFAFCLSQIEPSISFSAVLCIISSHSLCRSAAHVLSSCCFCAILLASFSAQQEITFYSNDSLSFPYTAIMLVDFSLSRWSEGNFMLTVCGRVTWPHRDIIFILS